MSITEPPVTPSTDESGEFVQRLAAASHTALCALCDEDGVCRCDPKGDEQYTDSVIDWFAHVAVTDSRYGTELARHGWQVQKRVVCTACGQVFGLFHKDCPGEFAPQYRLVSDWSFHG